MRPYTKYSIYNKLGEFSKATPLRVLRFKRPKWLKLQQFLKKVNRKKFNFKKFNNNFVKKKKLFYRKK